MKKPNKNDGSIAYNVYNEILINSRYRQLEWGTK